MPRHKRQDSDLDMQAPWINTVNLTSTDQPIFSPNATTVSSSGLTRTGKANEQQRIAVSRESSMPASSASLPPAPGSDEGPTTLEAIMRFRGTRVKVKVTATHVSWKPLNPVGCCVDRRSLIIRVPFDEILSAALSKSTGCCRPRENSFAVYTFSRQGPSAPNTWRAEEYVLSGGSAEQVKEWVAAINGRVQLIRDRPRSLLVFINPYAGARRARHIWEREVLPVFQRARIQVHAVDTTKQDHAREHVEYMKAEELAAFQGVVAVGGDGLFQEVVSGLLARRARGDSAAWRIRVGHIPAGSTDAVAYTLHGSRSATTAALHIALGDRMSLDAGRIETHGSPGGAAAGGGGGGGGRGTPGGVSPQRHFVCMASYGFMGDVMRVSEQLRCLGPGRYDVTGALQYLRLASYRVAVSYREAHSTTSDVQQLCTAQCQVCRMAGIAIDNAGTAFARPSVAAVAAVAPPSANPAGIASATASPAVPSIAIPNSNPGSTVATPRGGAGGGGGGSPVGASATPSSIATHRYHFPASTTAAAGASFPVSTASSCSSGSAAVDSTPVTALPATPASSAAAAGAAPAAAGTGIDGSPGCFFRTSSPSRQASSLPQNQQQQQSPEKIATQSQPAVGGAANGAAASRASSMKAEPGGGGGRPAAPLPSGAAAAASGGSGEEGWTRVEGEFVSIMCVITPCRSDKSKRGVIPNGHLSDGRMYLVLVSRCSHLAFLRFLIRMATRGLTDRCLPFVRVIPVTGVRVSPQPGGHTLGGCLFDAAAPESNWNVDGELLYDNHVAINVVRGAVEVFARGVETHHGGGSSSSCVPIIRANTGSSVGGNGGGSGGAVA
ncbi:hypothetical protein Agub_g6596 [Astrephomene gubernaculifera]|uniref:DAGKc domain-containing protein n=1 Tax=Astrephomene gubernaculifera TaxID=47775 RepID=A0AAD3HLK0_9CHLO|nr:hypothetical protein Agub_g6596 [Astrephomene gubernaculifera]